MADEGADISQLTEAEQSALQQYISVTDQDPSAAIPLLRRSEWNAQIAISRFFDGEPVNSSPQAVADPDTLPLPHYTRRQETLADTFGFSINSNLRPQLDPAPRVMAALPSQAVTRPPALLSLLLTPVNVLYSVFSRIFSLFGYLFPFLPRLLHRLSTRGSASASQRSSVRRPLGPQDTTARFLREFDEEQGPGSSSKLPFLETGYARAHDLAKRELKFLIVIPISPEHEDTPTFVKNVLLSDTVIEFLAEPNIKNKTLLWAGSLQDSETFQVADSLKISQFPSTAIVAHTPSISSTSMSVVARITGLTTPEDFIATIQASMMQHEDELNRIRSERSEQQASRDLREQQNSAYERSLAVDRERARKKREDEEQQARKEKEQLARAETEANHARDLLAWKKWRASQLKSEPGPEVGDAVRVNIRVLDGERVIRRFAADSSIEEIYAFVECRDVMAADESEKPAEKPASFDHSYSFRMVSPMPREVYEVARQGILKEIIGRSATLIAEKIEDDDDSNDDE